MSAQAPMTPEQELERACDAAGISKDSPLWPPFRVLLRACERAERAAERGEALLGNVGGTLEAAAEKGARKGALGGVPDRRWTVAGMVVAGSLGLAAVAGVVGWQMGSARPMPTPLGNLTRQAAILIASNDWNGVAETCASEAGWRDPGSGVDVCPARLWRGPQPPPKPPQR